MIGPLLRSQASFAADFIEPSSARSAIEIFGTWLILLATIGTCLTWHNPLLYIIAIFIIASRQYALMILMHDGFHSLLHSNRKINHFISCIFLAYPCGSTYWIGRKSHLIHHATLGQDNDPDRDLYISEGKQSFGQLLLFFAKLPLGEQAKRTYGMKNICTSTHKLNIDLKKLTDSFFYILPVAIFQLSFMLIFYISGSLISYFILWLLPLFLTIVFNGIRVFCEHGNLGDYPGEKINRLISYSANPIELFFIAPFHMNYHAEHHLYPYVPHYRLPQLRIKMQNNSSFNKIIQWRDGYFNFLKKFISSNRIVSKVAIANEK